MSKEPTPAAREAHSAEVHCAWLPAGRAYGVTRGDPGWAGAAEAAIKVLPEALTDDRDRLRVFGRCSRRWP